ncbi:hypothetical protein MUK42_08517 [Musa troglodytarum]|uniref:Uncharacterized protein n=1 Tax=Musa troglodytarum TaxID=320322 RepID=A0A9E7K2D4_9LILI|nr:hypothetical protein MUK42_08517 [Musa troglodytarum]
MVRTWGTGLGGGERGSVEKKTRGERLAVDGRCFAWLVNGAHVAVSRFAKIATCVCVCVCGAANAATLTPRSLRNTDTSHLDPIYPLGDDEGFRGALSPADRTPAYHLTASFLF